MNALPAQEVELNIPGTSEANGTFDKELMESAFSWICGNAKSSDFHVTEFRSVEVEGYMKFAFLKHVDGTHDVTITWEKGGNGWRFTKVDWKDL